MAERTEISWCDATVNPIRVRRKDNGKVGTHCEKVSPACANCYAERQNARNLPFGTGLPYTVGSRDLVDVFCDEKVLEQVIRWKRGRRIFWCSMTDLFADFVPIEFIHRCVRTMIRARHHTHIVLTKGPQRLRSYFSAFRKTDEGFISFDGRSVDDSPVLVDPARWPIPDLWIGVTAEDQKRYDDRVPILLDTPAARWFVSIEPMLGPINTTIETELSWHDTLRGTCRCDGRNEHVSAGKLDWVIVGGESGRGARPMHPQWVRDVRNQCATAGVPFHFKQRGEWSWDCGYPNHNWGVVMPSGKFIDRAELIGAEIDNGGVSVHRVGKKRAGRLLDGCEHLEFP